MGVVTLAFSKEGDPAGVKRLRQDKRIIRMLMFRMPIKGKCLNTCITRVNEVPEQLIWSKATILDVYVEGTMQISLPWVRSSLLIRITVGIPYRHFPQHK
ncbi:hypothetical protein BOTNAR_0110g00190 [Botryotinia narcissicola]|uniref:Uncharacterized protein n=1 Tax=Botryotinia narcissicola TaxID=278944 RepID=A0A4Z1J1K1_9HELO|nr:hypothetical protein BOTNAR_0110g00190 [Botryotinia narcissicola]